MIEQELKDILKRQGITQESVVQTYVRAINVGESRGDAAAMVRGNDRLAALVGLDIGNGGRKMLTPPTNDDLEAEAMRLMRDADTPKLLEGASDAEAA
jgi:hypothetical protein